jgi:glycosyltransferase involved in cell wall biosynthesis
MLDPWSLRFRAWKKAPYLRVFERRNLLGAAAVHVVSRQEERAVEALGLPIRPVTIPHGVDQPAVRGSEGRGSRSGATGGVVNVLFLSRLHPKKGVELLLEAIEALPQGLCLRLVIAGDGDAAYVKQLQARAGSAKLKHLVTFTGFVEGAEKQRLLENADFFVLPSYDENFGMAVAEALSAGLPVLVSENVALADHVRQAGAGLVVPCNAPELSQAVATLASDPDLRRRMGQAGQQLANVEFSWTEAARRLAALYQQVTASRPRSSEVACSARPTAVQ